jgi:hypothetical protein
MAKTPDGAWKYTADEERIGCDQEIFSSQAIWQNTAVARPVWRIDVSPGFSDMREPGTHLDFDIVATRIQ